MADQPSAPIAKAFALYIVACADGTYYTGIASDVLRRINEHNGSAGAGASTSARGKGARYTAGRRPVRLVYTAHFETRSAALKEEARIKTLTRGEKLALIRSWPGTTEPAS